MCVYEIYIYIYICVCVCVYVFVCNIYIYIYIYVCVCVCVCIDCLMISINRSTNQTIIIHINIQVERTYDGETIIYSIIVNRLEPRDAGWYTCQIHVRGSDERPSKDGEMVVLSK